MGFQDSWWTTLYVKFGYPIAVSVFGYRTEKQTDRQTDRQTEKHINAAEYPTTRLPSVYNSAIGTRVGLVSYYIPCVVLIILCQWRCFHCFV